MTPGTSNEKAVAEIVGSLILISIFVLAFAILAMVLLSQPAPQKIPAIAISITNQSKIIRISHESGDSIAMNEVKVLVDEVPQAFTCNDCGDSWSIGETLTIDCSDHLNFPNKVDIVFSGSGTAQRLLSSIYFGTMTPTQTPVTLPTSPTPVTTTTTLPAGAPVANFTGTPTSGPVPLTVAYRDMSTNSPTSWLWNFGDGDTTNSTAQNPVHRYANANTYTVTLVATNNGGSNSSTRTNYITVNPPPPVVSFNGTPTTGILPLTVVFTDSSTNNPTSWSWNFGDGDTTNSTFQSPVHWYANAGTFTVTLTAANAGGSNATTRANYITVYPQPPVAGFTGTPTTGSNPLSVVFTDSSTNTPTSWLWDFGDGDTTNSTVKNPVHRYVSAGTYTVSLTATNAGGSGSTTRTGYIVVNNTVIQASRMYLNAVKTSDLVSGGYIQFTVRGSSSSIRHGGVTINPKNNDVVRLTINSDTRGQIYASNNQLLAFSFDDVGLSINSYNYGRAAINSIYIQNSVSSSSTLKLNVPFQSGWTDLRADGTPIINGVSSATIGVYNLWSIPTGITNLDNRFSTYYDGPVTGYSIT